MAQCVVVMDCLAAFDPRVRDWFRARFPAPTEIQELAWPRIAAGEHVLLTAPTGSGKTLTAFLWALDRLITGAWSGGAVRVLYVSPSKALNNDIRCNLLEPLAQLEATGISVAVRSGDTPQSERRRMLRRPPEILVTTPESLNLLLASPKGRVILGDLYTVILDEIHAVAGGKRGTYLMTAVERLVELSGEFQRVALSATVRPLEAVASFVGGFLANGTPRAMRVLASESSKRREVRVLAVERPAEGSSWPPLVEEFRGIIDANRSTLFFVNNRALSEKLVRWINEEAGGPAAYAHHGSLSREIRTVVEQRLKEGSLKAIAATSSLELGIDIGSLDEVVLVQTPRTLNGAVQRVGRAGHGVGETSRARLYPTHGRDFLDAAVLGPLVEQGEIETLRPIRNPLDVLAQVILSMCAVQPRTLDEIYAVLWRSWPYHALERGVFDRVVAMLGGRYEDTRLRELRPRLRIDAGSGVASGVPGALPLLYRSGGVIPDRGYYSLRVQGSGVRLGDLDEEFVWERRVGDTFTFGARPWRILRISRDEVEVVPFEKSAHMPPFWKAEQGVRDFEFCEHIGLFLEEADRRLEEPAFAAELVANRRMDEGAAGALMEFLRRQKSFTGKPLPHRRHLLVEVVTADRGRRLIVHAPWGGRVLRPWAIALSAASERRFGVPLETFCDDDCILLQPTGRDIDADELLGLVRAGEVDDLLLGRIDRSGLFGTLFRENATRALLLPRSTATRRVPLWMTRLRAKKLLAAVRRYDDFPVVAETWRACLEDEFDLPRLRALLEEVEAGTIRVGVARTGAPSPFARGVAWHATNLVMYEDDMPEHGGGRSLSEAVLEEVLTDAALRPRLDAALIGGLEAKLQRTAPGYEPRDRDETLDLVETHLLTAPGQVEEAPGIERVAWGGGWLVSAAQRPRLERARAGDDAALAECVAEFLRGRGPVTLPYLASAWGVDEDRMESALARLTHEGRVVADRLTEGAPVTEFCETENLERLLRAMRSASRVAFEPQPLERLPLFLATWQGLVPRGAGGEDLRTRLDRLFGYAAPAALWEEAILPARMHPYEPDRMDALFQEGDLIWFGAGRESVGFCFEDDLPLFLGPDDDEAELFPGRDGRFSFFDLERHSGLDSKVLTERLWSLAWEGKAANDTFAALRRGVETGFRPIAARPRRRGLSGWRSSRPLLGNWRRLHRPAPVDRLDALELDKERVRQLLARHGILFREVCRHELPELSWGRLQRALRLMELSGEVASGRYFSGVEGLQFATAGALRVLREGLPEDAAFLINAADPASVCGTGLFPDLPARHPSSWVVYRGSRPVVVARRNGKQIELLGDAAAEHVELLGELLTRPFRPLRRIVVESVDGEPAAVGARAVLLSAAGYFPDRSEMVLERSYGAEKR